MKPQKTLVSHEERRTSDLAILSTCPPFALYLQHCLKTFIKGSGFYRDSSCFFISGEPHGKEILADHRARRFLATGTSSYIYDGPSFVTETYALLNPFHVCEVYGRYASDFSYPLRSSSVLLDGFKRVFIKALNRVERCKIWSIDRFKEEVRRHRKMLLMSQEYLIPLLIQQVCDGDEHMSPFFKAILDFFKVEMLELKMPMRELFRVMILTQRSLEERLYGMLPLIKGDREGVYFPFCYLLRPKEAFVLKDMLLKDMGRLPEMRSDFKNGVFRNMQALMRTAMRENVGRYLEKLRAHEEKVLIKRIELESHLRWVSSFRDVLTILSPSHDGFYTEDELKTFIKVNGRSVSFVIDDEEYVIKVRKDREDMRDHAEIACGLADGEKDIQDHYGAVFYAHLDTDIVRVVHDLILDKSQNPRISLTASDLTENAVIFKVKHTYYFEYLSDPDISMMAFKDGLRKTIEQALRQMKERGRVMETLSDIAHDKDRPGIFLPMVYFLDYINGIFLGTFKYLKDSYKTVDACRQGLRDLGNALTSAIKKNIAFGISYATYLNRLYDQMTEDGQDREVEDMVLINNLQEAIAHTLMTIFHLFLIRLSDHPEELADMSCEQFIKDLEDVLIKPFICILGLKDGVDRLRPFYEDMLKKDFEDFKAHPHHFEYTLSIFRQGDLSRNNYYQSFYRLTYFLMSLKGWGSDRGGDLEDRETHSEGVVCRDDGECRFMGGQIMEREFLMQRMAFEGGGRLVTLHRCA